jgi:chromosome segregation ATPase
MPDPERGPVQIAYGMAPDERALSFLEALADEWAIEIDLPHFINEMYGSKEKVDALVKLAFVEAAYRGFEARKALGDAMISAVNNRLQSDITALHAQITALTADLSEARRLAGINRERELQQESRANRLTLQLDSLLEQVSALTQERGELEAEVACDDGIIAARDAQIMALTAERDAVAGRLEKALTLGAENLKRATAAEARARELAGLLRPFASLEAYASHWADDMQLFINGTVTAGDVRAVVAALSNDASSAQLPKTFAGMPIVEDPTLPPGTFELRQQEGSDPTWDGSQYTGEDA